MKTEQELREAHFTDSGVQRYLATETAYSDELFKKATLLGEADRGAGLPLEVTHDHVRRAASALESRPQQQSGWTIAVEVGELLCAAGAGVGGNNLPKPWAIILFGLSLALGIILYMFRKVGSRRA